MLKDSAWQAKDRKLFKKFRYFKYDVLLLQKMYCTTQESFNYLVVEFKAQGGLSLSPSSSRAGTAIFVRATTNFLLENIYQCTPDAGYAAALDISKNQCFYRII